MLGYSDMTRDEQCLLEEKYNGKKTVAYGADREPLGYVIGWQPFLGLKIHLDSKPLIPRPETEWWTERLFRHISTVISGTSASDGERHEQIFSRKLCVPRNHGADVRFLDLCAGSGAIGCAALAQLPNAEVYFGDIDPVHETTIAKNIRENHLDESRAHIRIGDLFSAIGGPASGEGDVQFDIIAANPPYVPVGRALPASVSEYEPARALYAGADGLDVIRRIAAELPKHLARNGTAWIECDSSHAAALHPTARRSVACSLFKEQGFHTEIRNDQYGNPRIIVVSFL